MPRKKVGISMPVANEEASIGLFLDGLLRESSALGEFEFKVYVVMDGYSKDKTAEIAGAISKQNPAIELVYFGESTGVVSCYIEGFRRALAAGCDYVIEMDSGGSHPPVKLREMLHALDGEGYDAAFMSRFMAGAGTRGFPLYRRAISRGGTMLANLWLGMGYTDSTGGFEGFRADLLRRLRFEGFISTGGMFQTEMKYYCHCLGCRAKEIPYVYAATSSTFKPGWVADALRILLRLKANRKNAITDAT